MSSANYKYHTIIDLSAEAGTNLLIATD